MKDYQFTITRMDGIMIVTMSDDGYPLILICLKFQEGNEWLNRSDNEIFQHVYEVWLQA